VRKPGLAWLTLVYNMEDFWQSVLKASLSQTYRNFEYVIVNNRSTDRSLEIALDYAKKDNRIRVRNNDQFVGVMENHNIALSLSLSVTVRCVGV
jgi:glycosyltransferase involved in cell wall biosynthesis